jgi:hypothetical protein
VHRLPGLGGQCAEGGGGRGAHIPRVEGALGEGEDRGTEVVAVPAVAADEPALLQGLQEAQHGGLVHADLLGQGVEGGGAA